MKIDCGYRWWAPAHDSSNDTPPLTKAQIIVSMWHITAGMLSRLARQLEAH